MASLPIDEVFKRIGGNGRFQKIFVVVLCYVYMVFVAFHVMVIAFIAGEPNWECVQNSTICNLTEPVTTVSKNYKDRCSMPRSEWKFSDVYTSTVTEYELICDHSILQSVASSVYWIGWLIGNVLIGYIADKYGRKIGTRISAVVVFLFSWIIIWPKGLWVFIVCRFLTGVGSGGLCMCCFVLLVEFSDSKQRGTLGSSLWLSGPIAYSVLIPLFGYFIRDWRYLLLAGALVGTPAIIFVWFVPESPRYLLIHNRYDETRAILTRVAKWNKTEMPEESIVIPKQADDEKSDFRDLFYNKSISLITLTTWFTWFTTALMFYAVSYGAVYLGGQIYLNFFLTNIILTPANITTIFTIKKFGRKKNVVVGLFVSAITAAIAAAIPADRSNSGYNAGRIVLAVAGKFFIYVTFITIYVQGAEVFPTTIRNTALGTASAWGRIGSFIALYIIWLERVHALLPYSILGVLCLLSGIACLIILPETKQTTTREVFAMNPRTRKWSEEE